MSSISALQPQLSHPKYRPDIDGLRALAVLSVVAFHAFPGWVKGGFIGVDVFFVISGYLISTIIFENLDKGTFSFAEFYARRIKRIFPALIVVILASFAFGWFALLTDEYKQLGKHIVAGAGFVSNIVLWNEAGYFDSSAETKPLLHLWSLGIEEQFYIVWPLLLWFAWKRKFNLLTITILVAVVSFYLNVKGVKHDVVATFYSPQTRFWELLCGSSLAWAALYKKGAFATVKSRLDGWIASAVYHENPKTDENMLANVFSIIGLYCLVYGYWKINKQIGFPGKWAVIPVLGAVLIIMAGPKAWVNRTILSNKVAVWFGLISFPLYLWHWPLLAFARIVESELPSRDIRMAVVVLSVTLAWMTYWVVEKPIRQGGNSKIKVATLVILMTLVAYLGYNSFTTGRNLQYTDNKLQPETRKLLTEAKRNCDQQFPEWATFSDSSCSLQRETHNSIAIIGDSHASQLFMGVGELLAPNDGVAVFSASCAAPYINIATGLKDVKVIRKREGAYKLINRAYDFIIKDPTIKVVVLAHNPACSFNDAVDKANLDNKDYREVLKQGMKRTFSALLDAKKSVLVLFDNPPIDYDPKLCEKRPFRLTQKSERCSFSREQFEQNQPYAGYRLLVDEVIKDYPQVKTFDLSKLLCDNESCYINKNGNLIYMDQNHLNADGSRYVAPYLLSMINTMK